MQKKAQNHKIATKNFQILPFGMLGFFYFFIKDAAFLNKYSQTCIAIGMAILSLLSLFIVLRRQYKYGKIKKAKQKLLAFSLFVCISIGAYTYYHFFIS
ncbi:MAG: hypothetical protein ACTH5N_02620 [Psychroflexus halocasei]